jgi:hypothetical protein
LPQGGVPWVVLAFAATNEGGGWGVGSVLNRGGVSTETPGVGVDGLTYTNSSPSIGRSVPLIRDDCVRRLGVGVSVHSA